MRMLLGSFLLWTLAACGAETGASLEILEVAMRSAQCVVEAPATAHLSNGTYDPRGFVSGWQPAAYSLDLNVQNNLVRATSDPATSFSQTNRRADANDAQIMGFDVCWLRADAEGGSADARRYDGWTDGVPDKLKCDNLSASHKAFVAASATASAAGGVVGIAVDVLDLPALKSLYGGDFDPVAIPAIGGTTVGGPYYYAPTDPTATVRDAAWGTYPHAFMARVLVEARALGKTQTGQPLRSNWFVFPVDICVGCVADVCGPTTVVATTCAATGLIALGGDVVNPTSCLPSQGYEPVCATDWVSCF